MAYSATAVILVAILAALIGFTFGGLWVLLAMLPEVAPRGKVKRHE